MTRKFVTPRGETITIGPKYRIRKKTAMSFWVVAHYHPRQVAAALWPDKPPGAVRAAGQLGNFAANFAVIGKEQGQYDTYAQIAQGIWDAMPDYARVIAGPRPKSASKRTLSTRAHRHAKDTMRSILERVKNPRRKNPGRRKFLLVRQPHKHSALGKRGVKAYAVDLGRRSTGPGVKSAYSRRVSKYSGGREKKFQNRRPARKNPKRKIVRVRSHEHRDFSERLAVRKPRYAHQSGPQRYAPIRYDITFETITPESAAEGDAEERGYEEKGLTEESVDDMIRTLKSEGATEPSSPHWHRGIWYTAYGDQNYRDGSQTNRSFHIRAPEATERAIARAMGVRGA